MESNGRVVSIKNLFWLLSLLFVVNIVDAQDAASIPAGPFDITPSINIRYDENDNFFGTPTNQQSVSTTVVVPSISAVTDNGVTRFALRYSLENGDRSDLNSAFDYTDHELSTELDWQANVRNRVSLGWALSDGHSDPSSDNSEQQNEFERTKLMGLGGV